MLKNSLDHLANHAPSSFSGGRDPIEGGFAPVLALGAQTSRLVKDSPRPFSTSSPVLCAGCPYTFSIVMRTLCHLFHLTFRGIVIRSV